MSLLGTVGDMLGFSQSNPHTVNANDYSQYYNQAIADLQGAGDPTSGLRNSIYNNAQQQAGQLDNYAQARRKAYADDMNRNFAGQVQSVARAKGGTGTLQQAMRPSGESVDANNRAVGRGFLDLQSQAIKDLGSLQGIQNGFYNQDMQRQGAIANARMGQGTQQLGQANTNADYMNNVENQQAQRLGGTLGALYTNAGKGFGMASGKPGSGGGGYNFGGSGS